MSHSPHLLVLDSLSNLLSALLSELASISDTKAVLENFLDLLKSETRDFRVEEVDQDIADTADGCVEGEGSDGSDTLHHAQEGR